jgi:SgrR family transcriptional regulator
MSVRREALRKLMEHYSPTGENGRFTTTLDELAPVLGCTRRAAQLMLKRMTEEGWISWQPGVGRGHFSTLVFIESFAEILLAEAKKLAASGQWDAAWRLLQNGQVGEAERQGFAGWLASGGAGSTAPGEEKDALRFVLYRPVLSLDPVKAVRRTEQHLVSQLFGTLLVFDRKEKCLRPHLAHGWECTSGGRTCVFYLRKGIRFHDGRECTSEDAAYTMERLSRGDAGAWLSALFQDIVRIEAPTPYTLTIHLSAPNYALPAFLTLPGASIVPRSYENGERPVGTGPFRLVHKDAHKLELAAFAAYREGRPYIDRVEIWSLPAVYEAGRPALALEAAGKEVNLQQYNYTKTPEEWIGQACIDRGCKLIVINSWSPDQPAARQQFLQDFLFSILDRQLMVNELGGNRYTAARTVAIGSEAAYLPLDRECGITGNTEGWKPQPVILATNHGAGNERDAQWIQDKAQAAGIPITISYLSDEELYQSSSRFEADLILMEQPVGDDEEAFLALFFHSESGVVRRTYSGENEQDWLHMYHEKYTREPDRRKRLELLRAMEERLLKEGVIYPLYRWLQTAHYPPHVCNVAFDAYGWVDYSSVWFRTQLHSREEQAHE